MWDRHSRVSSADVKSSESRQAGAHAPHAAANSRAPNKIARASSIRKPFAQAVQAPPPAPLSTGPQLPAGVAHCVTAGRPLCLDTPEQLVHGPAGSAAAAVPEHPLDTLAALQKRAARKAVSRALATGLVRVAKGPLMGKAYARTAEQCGQLINQQDGKLCTYWCGYRWCSTCGAIRTARAYAAYGDTVRSWPDAQLVTLTVPNVSAGYLRDTVKRMHAAFAVATRALKRAHGPQAVQLIRATEVTYSAERGDYHPHMHCMVRGIAVADALRDAWLERWPTASRAAQDVRPATEKGLAEVFKYATKLATSDRKLVPLEALDTIYTALRGLRLWQAVGITAVTPDADADDDTAELAPDVGTAAVTRPTECITWQWQQGARDWVDMATGECLTGYMPHAKRERFLVALEAQAAQAACEHPPDHPASRIPQQVTR
jgi:hypothetical protein